MPGEPRRSPEEPASASAAELVRFYDRSYTSDPAVAQRYQRWRALGAVGKADHVERLCRSAGVRPALVADVGCGDGALLSELDRRGFGRHLDGFEITEAAVALARQRPEPHAVHLYDGRNLPVCDGHYDLAIMSHVLEHVQDPVALLCEVARGSRAVVVEVPLEANLSAARASKREGAGEVGHLQRFDRDAVRVVVAEAGLRVTAELQDPLPLSVHRFFADTPTARLGATLKWGTRAAVAVLAPATARRLFTLHYACLCQRAAT